MLHLNEMRDLIVPALRGLNIQKVIVFGSYSKGNQTPQSDIDLLVVTNDDFIPENFMQKMVLKTQIAKALQSLKDFSDIDLIVHTKPMYERFLQLDSGFKREILNTGTVIYETHND